MDAIRHPNADGGLRVEEVIGDSFVLKGIENDDWHEAYRVWLAVRVDHVKKIEQEVAIPNELLLEWNRLAVGFFWHKNILVLIGAPS